MTLSSLTVFIASPSDVANERETAFKVVGEVNGIVQEFGWHIDLVGWEGTPPGVGRPQARINNYVDRCDVFIGILWRRWGTPPGKDAQYTSGFEEEFERAEKRNKGTSSPEIWLFFKDVNTEQSDDPGSQLQRVIAFREGLIAKKELLFGRFKDLED